MKVWHVVIFISLLNAWITGASAEERPYVMGAIGDSISAGFNAMRYGDNRELSWSGGMDAQGLVQSHARRLKELLGDREVRVVNEAFVGADSTQLPRQAARLLRVTPDYVTVAIGANDVCTWYDDYLGKLEAYRKNVTAVIERIIVANPKVKIVLLPVPSIKQMYDLGVNRSGCQAKWDTMGVCRPLLAFDRTPEDRERFFVRYHHLNQTIADIAASYPANIRFASALSEHIFDVSVVSSLDCFHPSIKGHNLISDLTFDPTWY